MQGYETESGAIGVEDVDCWPPDGLGFSFLLDIDKFETTELLNVRDYNSRLGT